MGVDCRCSGEGEEGRSSSVQAWGDVGDGERRWRCSWGSGLRAAGLMAAAIARGGDWLELDEGALLRIEDRSRGMVSSVIGGAEGEGRRDRRKDGEEGGSCRGWPLEGGEVVRVAAPAAAEGGRGAEVVAAATIAGGRRGGVIGGRRPKPDGGTAMDQNGEDVIRV